MGLDLYYQVDIKVNDSWQLNVEKDIEDDPELSPLLHCRCYVWHAFLTGISHREENIDPIVPSRGYPDDRLALARKYNLYEPEEDLHASIPVEDKNIEEALASSYSGFGYTWVLLSELRDYDYSQELQLDENPNSSPITLKNYLGENFFEYIDMIRQRHIDIPEENIRLFFYFSC